MATAAITTSIFQEIQSFNQNRRTDLQQLGTALQSGNLDAAKQAFNDLASIGQNGPYRTAEPFSNSTRAQAFEAIGKALQSGDLAGAQAAFATLQSTFAKNQSAGSQATSLQSGTPAVIVNVGQNTRTTGVSDTESIYQQLS
jgi:soluble cytochrome b562